METSQETKLWTSLQAYVLSIVCLLLGVVTGYLLHAPAPANLNTPSSAAAQAPHMGPTQAMAEKVTQSQLKHMADKQAEPLLAQLQKNPSDPALLAQIGKVYAYAREFDTSADYYERSVKIKTDPRVLTNLSTVYHFAGNDAKAIDTINRALQVDPGYADALFNLGMLKWQVQSDPKAAIAAWQKLLKTNPNHPKRAEVEQMIARAKQHMNLAAGGKTSKPAL